MIDIRYLVFITYSTGCTYNWLPIYIYIYVHIHIPVHIQTCDYIPKDWMGEPPAGGPRQGGGVARRGA